MSLGPWFYVLLIGIGGLHLLVALLVVRFESNRGVNQPGLTAAGDDEPSSDHVTCGECGTANEVGYRYCRQCVSELPGTISAGRPETATAGREIF